MAVVTTQNYSRVEGEQPPAPQPDAIKKPAPEAIKKPAPEAIKKPAPEGVRKRLIALKKHFRPEGEIASEIDDIINEL